MNSRRWRLIPPIAIPESATFLAPLLPPPFYYPVTHHCATDEGRRRRKRQPCIWTPDATRAALPVDARPGEETNARPGYCAIRGKSGYSWGMALQIQILVAVEVMGECGGVRMAALAGMKLYWRPF